MPYTIVKNAGNHWEHFYVTDPKKDKVHISHSCYNTFTAQELNIKKLYDNIEEAEKDCERMNKANPVGDYAVCEVE